MRCNSGYFAFVRYALSSLYLNKGSSFETFDIYVKLSFTAEEQKQRKLNNRKTDFKSRTPKNSAQGTRTS